MDGANQPVAMRREGPRPRVLVTGIRGFTGQHLAHELETHGYEVVGTVLETPVDAERRLDVTSAADCASLLEEVVPDYVVHLAAISFVAHADTAAFYRVNTIGTTVLAVAVLWVALSALGGS